MAASGGDTPGLKFCAGFVDITPRHPVRLAGYDFDRGLSAGISSPLEANGVLMDAGERRCLIISLDVLYVGSYIRREVVSMLRGELSEGELLVCATHTHFAPSVDESKPRLGGAERKYVDFVLGQLGTLLKRLFEGAPGPGRLSYGSGVGACSINRRLHRKLAIDERRPRMNITLLAPNPRGPTDDTIRVLSLRGPGGETGCVLWNLPCHAVGSPAINYISADFPGAVRAALRKEIDGGLPVLFLQGFSGDVRPREPRRGSIKDRLVDALARPRFHGFTPEGWARWTDGLSRRVLDLLKDGQAQEIPVTGLTTRRLEVSLRRFLAGASAGRTVSFQCINLGEKVRLVGVSAEPVAAYARYINELCDGSIAIPVGCIDDVFGYLPSEEMVSLGGYEVDGFFEDFSLSGRWRRGFEAVCKETFGCLIDGKQAGEGVQTKKGAPR